MRLFHFSLFSSLCQAKSPKATSLSLSLSLQEQARKGERESVNTTD